MTSLISQEESAKTAERAREIVRSAMQSTEAATGLTISGYFKIEAAKAKVKSRPAAASTSKS